MKALSVQSLPGTLVNSMIWSRYSYLFQEGDSFYIYNSLSNSFAELDNETYALIAQQIKGKNVNIADEILKADLQKMKVIVDNDQDLFLRLKYKYLLRRFANSQLSLTINPTLDCNFACPYCFEGKHPQVYMSDKVEDGIVSFVKKHEQAKTLTVTWFGGEPLLAFNRMISLTQKLLALGLEYEAGMITNGYLLTDRVINRLVSLKIKSIQVTVDGLREVHDSRRCLKNGYPTFDRIIENIKHTHTVCPDIKLNVRVNIDRTNEQDFLDLYKMFQKDELQGIYLTPAFVDDIENVNKCVLNSEEQNAYINRLLKEKGIVFDRFYPTPRLECFVRNPNSVVIGPEGELYKCWNDVGKNDRVYGYLDGRITNELLLFRYLAASDPFDDEKCKDCLLLPVCGGGCPYERIQRDYEGNNMSVCPLIKGNLKSYLLNHCVVKNKSL